MSKLSQCPKKLRICPATFLASIISLFVLLMKELIFSLFQVDLSSFLLQHSPDGQPIYEEIPTIRSEQNSEYVDTTSGYHTLSIDSEYAESERGLFLVPVSSHNTPLIVSKVPGRKTNKQFFMFHSKTLGKKEPPKGRIII